MQAIIHQYSSSVIMHQTGDTIMSEYAFAQNGVASTSGATAIQSYKNGVEMNIH